MNDSYQDEIERLKREVERLQKQIEMSAGTQQTRDVANLPSLIENLEFITDLARYAEGLFSEAVVKKKYRFSDDAWERLGDDDALVEAIEAEKIRRIRNGSTARERAQQLFAQTPDVLGNILNDDGASPRHRIESAREIRQIAATGPQATPAADRFIITIDLGADHKLTFNKSIKPDPNDVDIIDAT